MKKPAKKFSPMEKPHCVFDKKTGAKVACFKTLGEAKRHLSGLGAPKKKPGCGCGG
jgi:hypothetical protein